MKKNDLTIRPEELKDKIVEDVAITNQAVVLKFTDGTFLDVYVAEPEQKLITSINKLQG